MATRPSEFPIDGSVPPASSKRPAEAPLEAETEHPAKKRCVDAEEGEIVDSSEEEYKARRRPANCPPPPLEDKEEAIIITTCDEEPCSIATFLIKKSDIVINDEELWSYMCENSLSGRSVHDESDWGTPVEKRVAKALANLVDSDKKKVPISSVEGFRGMTCPLTNTRLMAVHNIVLFF